MTARLDDWRWAAAAAALCAVWYAALVTGFDGHLLRPGTLGLVFNGMLEHLAQGRLDVPPGVIRDEGFLRDGRIYAYFGVLPALLRLPLLAGWMDTDVTRLSIVAAACLGAYWQLRAIGVVAAQRPAGPAADRLLACLALAVMLGGPQVQFLRASVYQEVTDWAAAFAAMFVCWGMRGVAGGFSGRVLGWMALAAGLALATRVSTGMGLYAALGLVGLVRARGPDWSRRLLARDTWPALALLALFLAATLALNWGRWGNPLTVLDLRLHLMNAQHPGRLERVLASGEFNPARIWYGLLYYFLPVWALTPHGTLLFADYHRLMVEAELPPASFLASDPLLVLLSGIFLARLRTAWRASPGLVAMAAGLALPALLMLGLLFMDFRYRQEFYPLLTATALGAVLRGGGAWLRRWAWPLTLAGIAAAHLFLLMYSVSRFGPADAPMVWAMLWSTLRRLGL